MSLLLLACLVAAANAWFAAARSTIPLNLRARIVAKRALPEKHPGRDDVLLLDLSPGRRLQVDREVFEAVSVGSNLNKRAWQRQLQCNGKPVALNWSADLRGMLWAMPAVIIVMALALLPALALPGQSEGTSPEPEKPPPAAIKPAKPAGESIARRANGDCL